MREILIFSMWTCGFGCSMISVATYLLSGNIPASIAYGIGLFTILINFTLIGMKTIDVSRK